MALTQITTGCRYALAALFSTVLQCTSTVPRYVELNSALCYIALNYFTLCYTALYCTALHWATLHSITLHCIALHCVTLHSIVLLQSATGIAPASFFIGLMLPLMTGEDSETGGGRKLGHHLNL